MHPRRNDDYLLAVFELAGSFSPVKHVTIDLLLLELLPLVIGGDGKQMNGPTFWRFYHDLILEVNPLR